LLRSITIVSVLALLFYSISTLQPISSENQPSTFFVSSDPGDDLFASMFAEMVPGAVVSRCNFASNYSDSASIIYVLDYNLNPDDSKGCNSWPQGLGSMLLELAKEGSSVVLGYNTLRTISIFEPGLLSSLGLVFLDDSKPTPLYIETAESIRSAGAPEKVPYDVSLYHRVKAVPHSDWTILARFSDGAPAIVEERIGGGRVILVLFNPVWPAINGEKSYVDLFVALHRYIASGQGTYIQPIYIAAASVMAGATASLAISTSQQKSDDVVRRVGKVFIVLGLKSSLVDPLRNPIREQIYRLAEEKPYITNKDIVALGVKRTPALWHLEVLVSAGLLASKKVFGKTIYFKPGKQREALIALALESEHRRKILHELLEETHTITWLSKALSLSKSTVKHHIDVMLQLGIVEDKGVGYKVSEWAGQTLLQLSTKVKT